MLPYLLIFTVFTVLPVLMAMGLSLTSFNALEPPVFVGWLNYKRLFVEDPLFLTAFKNTMVFAVATGPAGYLLSLLLAWMINDLAPFKRSFMTLLFYAPSMCNIFVVWKLIFSGDSYGVLNAYLMEWGITDAPIYWLSDTRYIVPVVILVILWSSMGTSFLAFIAGFQSLDRSQFEAAAVDGVKNRFQEFWFITLPNIKPQLMFGAIMSITAAFGVGAAVTALVGFPSPNYAAHTMVHHMEDYGTIRFEFGYASAIATILFLLMIVTNKLIQKWLGKVGS